ncbi:MAG: hypothetical protein KAX15_02720 [Candidatus Omnitrophica bacterium]|nr:hypothetical protein [Candidatus Omnitrophota bacterium]
MKKNMFFLSLLFTLFFVECNTTTSLVFGENQSYPQIEKLKTIKSILKEREGLFYPGEINSDSSMLSITLLMRPSFALGAGLFKEIAYSLIPELREVVGDKKIIRLWFQGKLPGNKTILYGKATHPTALSKIKFKFYSH